MVPLDSWEPLNLRVDILLAANGPKHPLTVEVYDVLHLLNHI